MTGSQLFVISKYREMGRSTYPGTAAKPVVLQPTLVPVLKSDYTSGKGRKWEKGVHAIRNIIQHPRISIKRRIQEPNRLLSRPQSRLIQSRNNCRENWRTGRSTSIGGRITSGVNLSPMISNFLNMSITSFGTYSIIIPIRTNIRNPSTNAIVNSITIPYNSSNIWHLTRIR